MAKQDKINLLEAVKSDLEGANGFVVANFKGLSVMDQNKLRKKIEAEGGYPKVLKNTLLEKLFESMGISGMEVYLKENTMLFATKEDAVKMLRVIADFSKENDKLVIKGGYVDGKVFDKAGVIEMSKMPSRKELLAMVVGGVNSVITSFVGTLNGVLTTFIGTVEALEKKKTEQN